MNFDFQTLVGGVVIYLAADRLAQSAIKTKDMLKKKVLMEGGDKSGPNFSLDEYQRDDFAKDLLFLNEMDEADARAAGIVLGDSEYYRGLTHEEDDITNQVATQQQVYVTPLFNRLF
jgi:hypothetical protein